MLSIFNTVFIGSIANFLWIWLGLMIKSLMENFIFLWSVLVELKTAVSSKCSSYIHLNLILNALRWNPSHFNTPKVSYHKSQPESVLIICFSYINSSIKRNQKMHREVIKNCKHVNWKRKFVILNFLLQRLRYTFVIPNSFFDNVETFQKKRPRWTRF